jgi:alkylation response protein AidB-like acyl-CoA dehydrogenase
MTYQAPVDDILHALKTAAGLDDLIGSGLLDGVDEDTIRAVLAEAGKFGAEVLDPLSAPGDLAGSKLVDGKVVTPPGWKEAYQQFAAGGWGALAAPEEWGGQNLPQIIATAAGEVWNASNLAFGLCPLLTFGAIDAVEAETFEALLERTHDAVVGIIVDKAQLWRVDKYSRVGLAWRAGLEQSSDLRRDQKV